MADGHKQQEQDENNNHNCASSDMEDDDTQQEEDENHHRVQPTLRTFNLSNATIEMHAGMLIGEQSCYDKYEGMIEAIRETLLNDAKSTREQLHEFKDSLYTAQLDSAPRMVDSIWDLLNKLEKLIKDLCVEKTVPQTNKWNHAKKQLIALKKEPTDNEIQRLLAVGIEEYLNTIPRLELQRASLFGTEQTAPPDPVKWEAYNQELDTILVLFNNLKNERISHHADYHDADDELFFRSFLDFRERVKQKLVTVKKAWLSLIHHGSLHSPLFDPNSEDE